MNFNIGDKVIEISTGIDGRITDKLYSEAKAQFVYVIKPSDGGRSFTRDGDEIELTPVDVEYVIESEVLENLVLVVIYEVRGETKSEVCRGHGHVFHEGSAGIAQALSYASKKAFLAIDDGIYLKQQRRDD